MTESSTSPSAIDSLDGEVREELEWTPDLDARRIDVREPETSVIVLMGEVPTGADRARAVEAAYRVHGVTTVIDELTVAVRPPAAAGDEEAIAHAVQSIIRAYEVGPENVRAEVKGDEVVLTGEVLWNYERAHIQHVIERLPGVRRVDNRISLSRRPSAADTGERIRNAIIRQAALDAAHLDVSVDGTRVTLTGTVSTWQERAQAERTAWSSPHVTHVANEIRIVPRA